MDSEGVDRRGKGWKVVDKRSCWYCVSLRQSHHTSYGSLGNDFPYENGIDMWRQVQLLISQATLHENLCQCYIGW